MWPQADGDDISHSNKLCYTIKHSLLGVPASSKPRFGRAIVVFSRQIELELRSLKVIYQSLLHLLAQVASFAALWHPNAQSICKTESQEPYHSVQILVCHCDRVLRHTATSFDLCGDGCSYEHLSLRVAYPTAQLPSMYLHSLGILADIIHVMFCGQKGFASWDVLATEGEASILALSKTTKSAQIHYKEVSGLRS